MKLPRDLSGQEVARALQRMGFVVVRQIGSHIRLVRGSDRVTVANHKPIKPGTLSSILDQAGITAAELMENL